MIGSDGCWSDIWAGDTLQRGCKSHSTEIIITWLGLIVWATNIVSQLAVSLDRTHFKSLLWCSVQMGSENCSNNQYEEIWALVECVKCFWCSPFLCGCVPLMVGNNVEISNMDIEPLRYWVIKYSNTKCVHTFIHFVYDPFIFTILLQSRLSLSKEMKCYIYFPTFYPGEEEWNFESK